MAHRRCSEGKLAGAQSPRDRLKRLGTGTLTDDELLALVLDPGRSGVNPRQIARRAVEIFHTGVHIADGAVGVIRELCQVSEIKACQIVACLELGRRIFQASSRVRLSHPEAVYDHLRSMARLKKEAFRGLYLDVKSQVVHDEIISLGTLTMNLVHPREVFRPAIEHSAASVILVHNHPSGDPTPSAEDLKVTQQLVAVGRLIDIEVLDHVIVGEDGFISLRRKGLLGSAS